MQPVSSVVVNVSRFTQGQATITLSTEGVVDAQYSSVGGIITIPAEAIETAVNDRKMITLVVDGNTVGGYIIFLPQSESEAFTVSKSLSNRGVVEDDSNYWSATVELIDVTYATDIVYSGMQPSQYFAALVAYDEQGDYVRTLIAQLAQNSVVHVVPDGTYKYVRACSVTGVNASLSLVFPDRRRKSKKTTEDKKSSEAHLEKEDP